MNKKACCLALVMAAWMPGAAVASDRWGFSIESYGPPVYRYEPPAYYYPPPPVWRPYGYGYWDAYGGPPAYYHPPVHRYHRGHYHGGHHHHGHYHGGHHRHGRPAVSVWLGF